MLDSILVLEGLDLLLLSYSFMRGVLNGASYLFICKLILFVFQIGCTIFFGPVFTYVYCAIYIYILCMKIQVLCCFFLVGLHYYSIA